MTTVVHFDTPLCKEQPRTWSDSRPPYDFIRLPTNISQDAFSDIVKDWSGIGQRFDVDYHVINQDYQVQLKKKELLGNGRSGAVYKITYRSLDLARKSIKINLGLSSDQLQLLKTESAVGQRLDSHKHIIKLIGTYWKAANHFNIITFPVAICDLGHCLDVGQRRWLYDGALVREAVTRPPTPTMETGGHMPGSSKLTSWRASISDRLRNLWSAFLHWPEGGGATLVMNHTPALHGLPSRRLTDEARELFKSLGLGRGLSENDDVGLSSAADKKLREFMGCVTEGMLWMHSQGVQHRDLKPGNLLLRHNEVFLTDFGISRDRRKVDRSTTDYHNGFSIGYAAPEVASGDWHNARHADVYSLGCVFLHIITIVCEVPERYLAFWPPLANEENPHRYRELQFLKFLKDKKPWTEQALFPPNLVDFLEPMFYEERYRRPSMAQVDDRLKAMSNEGCSYYGPCCRPPSCAPPAAPIRIAKVGSIQKNDDRTFFERLKAALWNLETQIWNSGFIVFFRTHPGVVCVIIVVSLGLLLGLSVGLVEDDSGPVCDRGYRCPTSGSFFGPQPTA